MKLLVLLIALLQAACSTAPTHTVIQKPFDFASTQVIGLSPDGTTDLEGPIQDAFILKPLVSSQPLPDIGITGLDLTEQALPDAMRLMLAGTNISLVIQGTRRGAADVYGSVSAYNVSGKLPDVMERVSKAVGFFYTYSDGVLTVSPDQLFLVSLPPAIAEDTYAGVTNTIQSLGGFGITLDKVSRTLVFRANSTALQRISAFLRYTRENRSLIVYDVAVYQVDLTDEFASGIAWSTIESQGGGGAGITGGSALANGLSTIFTLRNRVWSQQAIVSLLQQYGKVTRVSQPRISVLSGGRGQFRQGNTREYVSKVGQQIGASVNSVSAETSRIVTGIAIDINGDIDSGTVYTRIGIKVNDFIQFDSFEALGVSLKLPTTADRELQTEVRSPLGDAVLLGGILLGGETKTSAGVPGSGGSIVVPVSEGELRTKSELVLVVSPKVVRFGARPASATAATEVPRAH